MKAILCAILILSLGVIHGETLKIVTEDYPPYEFLNKGVPDGSDVKIVQEAAKIAGFDVTFEFVPWARALEMVKTGSADGIISLFQNEEREAFLIFPQVHLSMEKNVIFSNSSSKTPIAKMSDLTGKTVGVMKDYSYSDEFDNSNVFKRDVSLNPDEMFKKLSGNRYQYAAYNEIVGWYMIKEAGYKGFKVEPLVLTSGKMFIGFSKASAKVKANFTKFDNALKEMNKSGALDTIRKKYTK